MTKEQPHVRPPSGVPARGYSNPQFPKGISLSTKHGVHSPRVYGPLAQELAQGLLDTRPDLADYPIAVSRWAEWEGRAMLMRRHLGAHGDLDGDGPDAAPRKSTKWLVQCEDRAERAAAVLGLDPFSEARLAQARAGATLMGVDLEAIATRGREIIRDRVRTGDWVDPPDRAGELLAAVKDGDRAKWAKAVKNAGGDDRHEGTPTAEPTLVTSDEPNRYPGGNDSEPHHGGADSETETG